MSENPHFLLATVTEDVAPAHRLRFGRSSGTYPFPLALCLEITPFCNFNCSFCLNAWDCTQQPEKELSTYDWYRIIDESAAAGVQNITLSGGEPTLKCDWKRIANHCLNLGLQLTLLTNGSRLSPADLDLLTRFHEVQVSLVSTRPDVFSAATGTYGQYGAVITTLKWLSKSDVTVCVNRVLLPEADDELLDFLDMMARLMVDEVSFSPFVPLGRGAFRRDRNLSPRRFEQCVEQIGGWSEHNPQIKVTFVGPVPHCWVRSTRLRRKFHNMCSCGRTFGAVDPWGRLRTCGCSFGPHGSVLEHGLLTLWNHIEMQRFRDGELLSEGCKSCESLRTCGSCAELCAAGLV